ncbi:hypothetical protein CFC21_063572 [Triticum aestivum]|uniref:Berberine/berberine-like domain-containing protein n=2 Tax=Triticum aestivum TaxID=4565 RepID=A0A9R1GZV8_WHEAT|nr:hypothetical protein CFC21_063572 [Triticum aestivum]
MMMRKHGLSSDKVLDATLVNAGMGEDLFWAIRGGGGGNFGIVLSWKVQLVQVPSTVVAFNIAKTAEQGAVDILTKWQDVAPSLPSDITLRVIVRGQQAMFQALYLGGCGSLVAMMEDQFPELGMTSADCQPMSWAQSAATPFLSFGRNGTLEEALLNRTTSLSRSNKGKSDYVRRAIPKAAWEDIFPWFARVHPAGAPRRYIVTWPKEGGDGGTAATAWIEGLYELMGRHVSKNPRRAYVNFRDLDIGQNDEVAGGTFEGGAAWGERYFVGNYRRLAAVKAAVDPTNYFRNEQSIPPLR